MSRHFHFDLGDIPPGGWVVLVGIALMAVGKVFEISLLFILGIVMLVVFGILVIYGLLRYFG